MPKNESRLREQAAQNTLKTGQDEVTNSCDASQPSENLTRLTAREWQFVNPAVEGFSNWEVSRQTGCSEAYINNKFSAIYKKLGIQKNAGGSIYDPRIRLTRLVMLYREKAGRQ